MMSVSIQKNSSLDKDGMARQLPPIEHNLDDNLRSAADQWPEKAATVFYGAVKSYSKLHAEVDRIAAYLQVRCAVKQGDRVGLFMQNSPQFVAGFYGIVRAGGVVVPLNVMYRTDELRSVIQDAGLCTVLTAQELIPVMEPLFNEGLVANVVVARYADELPAQGVGGVPEVVSAAPVTLPKGWTSWKTMLASDAVPVPVRLESSNLCALPYTSGSTGRGKGCRHTHSSVLHAVRCITDWFDIQDSDVTLAAAPMFHVVGMQAGMNATIAKGATLIILPRWDRDIAATLMREFGVTVWPTVPTAVIDFLNRPDLRQDDLSQLRMVFGGGSAMPAAIAQKLFSMTGLHFIECYGMTETMAPVTNNPPLRPKDQCAGVPAMGTEILILDPDTQAPLAQGETGEIAVAGPQVMLGYWRNEEADAEAFTDVAGKRFLRTGDLGHMDHEGYIFVSDRLKRMINVSGYKVWPAEIESRLYEHPAIAEVCVIRAKDPYRGETVKAVAVLKEGQSLSEADLTLWAQGRMAAYKVPRKLQLLQSLPKSGAGKVLWREIQEIEDKAAVA